MKKVLLFIALCVAGMVMAAGTTPVITSQPSNVEYTEDDLDAEHDISTSVGIECSLSCTYQWYNAKNNTPIEDETNNCFYAIEGGYIKCDSAYCIITSSAGSVKSNIARVYQVWDIYIYGNRITSLTKNDILGDGTMSFDGANLTINNLVWTDPDPDSSTHFIYAEESLNVVVNGYCRIISGFDASCIRMDNVEGNTLHITGKSLYLETGDASAIYVGGKDGEQAFLNIDNMEELIINTTSGGNGIEGSCLAVLSMTNSSIESNAIMNFESITMNGMGFVTKGDQISSVYSSWCGINRQFIANSEGEDYYNLAEETVKLEPIYYYPIWVANTQITNFNADDVLGDGKVSYDEMQEYLTFNNADINTALAPVLKVDNSNSYDVQLDVLLVGTNTFRSNANNAIVVYAGEDDHHQLLHMGVTFVGDTLNIITSDTKQSLLADAVSAGDQTCLIRIRDMKSFNAGNGLLDQKQKYDMYINNSYVSVAKSIQDFNSCQLTYTVVDNYPDASYQNGEWHATSESSSPILNNFVIRPLITYGLKVNNKDVTELNYTDILNDGHMSFDPENTILSLSNASFSGPANLISYTRSGDLTIQLDGTNTLAASPLSPSIHVSDGDLTIEGKEGSQLSITNNQNNGHAISINAGALTIKGGCKVDVKTSSEVNDAMVINATKMVVDSSWVNVSSACSGAIACPSPVLKNAAISEGAYDSNNLKIIPKINSGTAIENQNENQNEKRKVIENGQVIILRNGVRYNAMGQVLAAPSAMR